MMADIHGFVPASVPASDRFSGVDPAFVRELAAKAKHGMALARQMTARALIDCGARPEAASVGRHLVDSQGNLYATVRVDRAKTGVPLATGAYEVPYRLGINDRDPNVSAIEVEPDSAALLLPRLYEVDMDAFPRDLGVPVPHDPTGCMM